MNPRVISHQERPVRIWTNPTGSEFGSLPEVVRFTAVLCVREVHVWAYSLACHTDISAGLRLQDTYGSSGFLKGAALRQPDGRFVMFQSHFLESFRPSRLTGEERAILKSLLSQDWSWLNQYAEVTAWLDAFRKRFGM